MGYAGSDLGGCDAVAAPRAVNPLYTGLLPQTHRDTICRVAARSVRSVMIHRKAVRDRIPAIIRDRGQSCRVEVLTPERWRHELGCKLREEVTEYLESGDLEELADIVEVVHGLVAASGVTLEAFEHLRLTKRSMRGGFEDRLFLVSVE